jgi:hypothetical protein
MKTLMLLLVLSSVNFAAAAELKSFSPGELIRADEINANFIELSERISSTQLDQGSRLVIDCAAESTSLALPEERPLSIEFSGACVADQLIIEGPGDVELVGNPLDGGDSLSLQSLRVMRGVRLSIRNLDLRTAQASAGQNASLSFSKDCSDCAVSWGVGASGVFWEGGMLDLAEVELYRWEVSPDFGGTVAIRMTGGSANLKAVSSNDVGLLTFGTNVYVEGSGGVAFAGRLDIRGGSLYLTCGPQSYCDPLWVEVWASSAWIDGTPGFSFSLFAVAARVKMRGGSLRAIDVVGGFENDHEGYGTAQVTIENSRISHGDGFTFSPYGQCLGGSLLNGQLLECGSGSP